MTEYEELCKLKQKLERSVSDYNDEFL